MNKFKLILGDWSEDGHSIKKTVLFNCNRTIEELREMYFENVSTYGNVMENYCSEYGQRKLFGEDLEDLKHMGIDLSENIKNQLKKEDFAYIEINDMIDWFVQFMKLGNPSLILEHAQENHVPSFHFYGYDSKQRHIGQFGYGLFDH